MRLDALRCRLTRGLCSLGPGCSACPCWRSTRCRRCTCCLRRPSALNSLDLGKQIFIILAKQVVERENGNSRDTNLAWQCQYGKISKSYLGNDRKKKLAAGVYKCSQVRSSGLHSLDLGKYIFMIIVHMRSLEGGERKWEINYDINWLSVL